MGFDIYTVHVVYTNRHLFITLLVFVSELGNRSHMSRNASGETRSQKKIPVNLHNRTETGRGFQSLNWTER